MVSFFRSEFSLCPCRRGSGLVRVCYLFCLQLRGALLLLPSRRLLLMKFYLTETIFLGINVQHG
jgi:hypothetical protein